MESLNCFRKGRTYQTLDRFISAVALQAYPYDEKKMTEFRIVLFTSFISQVEDDTTQITSLLPTEMAIASIRMSVLQGMDLRQEEAAGLLLGLAVRFVMETNQTAATMIDDIEQKTEFVRKTS